MTIRVLRWSSSIQKKAPDFLQIAKASWNASKQTLSDGAEYNAALSKKMTPHPSRQLFFAELDHKSLSALANEILGTAEN